MASKVEVRVEPGLSPGLCEAAALAAPDRRFLNSGWFEAGVRPGTRTLVLRNEVGRSVAAIPIERRGWIRQVPGPYWPFRTFPIAEQAAVDGLAPVLMWVRRATACAAASTLLSCKPALAACSTTATPKPRSRAASA
jgi:hypothetical protein